MATVTNTKDYVGSVGKISYIKRHDLSETYIRTKGGPHRNVVNSAPKLDKMRKNNLEWVACSKCGLGIRLSMSALMQCTTYNISGPLNAIAKAVQKMDTAHEHGQRDIALSRYKYFLDGFSMNKDYPLSSVVRTPFQYSIQRHECKASVVLPTLTPGINFFNNFKRPYFKFIVNLGIVSDMIFDSGKGNYLPECAKLQGYSQSVNTSWYSAFDILAEQTIEIVLDSRFQPGDSETLLLGLGIIFGNPLSAALIEPVKYSGSAILLATG